MVLGTKKMATSIDRIKILNPVARTILQGPYDPQNPFHLLLGMHHLSKIIWKWNDVVAYWKSCIRRSHNNNLSYVKLKWGYHHINSDLNWIVRFPIPRNININMMPFIMEKNFHNAKLPEYLRSYWDQIIRQFIVKSEVGKIGYLTIQESFVDNGKIVMIAK